MRNLAAVALMLVWVSVSGCRVAPRTTTEADLAARVASYEQEILGQRQKLAERLLNNLLSKQQQLSAQGSEEQVTVDILLLSSGGQYGAFGVGVLDGWGSVQDGSYARPEFDIVTGVSTGALIAPFAISGTDYSIGRIAQLYQEADDSLAVLRGVFFFMPWRQSFFNNRGLIERIQREVDQETIASVAEAHREHRTLLIGVTDLDMGQFRIWDMGPEAEAALGSGDLSRFQDVMIASSSIPAAFPPHDIDGTLYTDGAASFATFFGLDRQAVNEVVAAFHGAFPDARTPRFRMWMIINGRLDAPVQLVEQSWVTIAGRSVHVLTSHSLRTTLRQMQFGAELIGSDIGEEVEFRFIAIPHDAELPESESRMFDRTLIQKLHTLGYALGRDPASWRTEQLGPSIPGSATHLPEVRFAPLELRNRSGVGGSVRE